MSEQQEPAYDLEEYIASKAGQLEDAINYPRSLAWRYETHGEIKEEQAVGEKTNFFIQLTRASDAPDYQSVTQQELKLVEDKALSINWQDHNELTDLVSYIREVIKQAKEKNR